MVEVVEETVDQVIDLPSGFMDRLRESYSSRERVLDWMLAIFVVAALVYIMWGKFQFTGILSGGVNTGKQDLVPNQNVAEAVGNNQPVDRIYTYNMPPARNSVSAHVGPTSVRIPFNPKYGGQFQAEYEEEIGVAFKGDQAEWP